VPGNIVGTDLAWERSGMGRHNEIIMKMGEWVILRNRPSDRVIVGHPCAGHEGSGPNGEWTMSTKYSGCSNCGLAIPSDVATMTNLMNM